MPRLVRFNHIAASQTLMTSVSATASHLGTAKLKLAVVLHGTKAVHSQLVLVSSAAKLMCVERERERDERGRSVFRSLSLFSSQYFYVCGLEFIFAPLSLFALSDIHIILLFTVKVI